MIETKRLYTILTHFLEYGITDLRNSQGALMANKSQVYTTLRLLSRYGLTQLQKFTTQLKAIKHNDTNIVAQLHRIFGSFILGRFTR
jgi:hypothetical protein